MSRQPRQQLWRAPCHGRIDHFKFKERNGQDCLSIFQGWSHVSGSSIVPPRFSVQVYVAFDVLDEQSKLNLAHKFITRIMSLCFEDSDVLRFDMHFIGQQSDAHRHAVEHYHLIQPRALSRCGLSTVPSYKDFDESFDSFCMVLARQDWEVSGSIDHVYFDPPQKIMQAEDRWEILGNVADDGISIVYNDYLRDGDTSRRSTLRAFLVSTPYWDALKEQYEHIFWPICEESDLPRFSARDNEDDDEDMDMADSKADD